MAHWRKSRRGCQLITPPVTRQAMFCAAPAVPAYALNVRRSTTCRASKQSATPKWSEKATVAGGGYNGACDIDAVKQVIQECSLLDGERQKACWASSGASGAHVLAQHACSCSDSTLLFPPLCVRRAGTVRRLRYRRGDHALRQGCWVARRQGSLRRRRIWHAQSAKSLGRLRLFTGALQLCECASVLGSRGAARTAGMLSSRGDETTRDSRARLCCSPS
jgi:hypothetical protein